MEIRQHQLGGTEGYEGVINSGLESQRPLNRIVGLTQRTGDEERQASL